MSPSSPWTRAQEKVRIAIERAALEEGQENAVMVGPNEYRQIMREMKTAVTALTTFGDKVAGKAAGSVHRRISSIGKKIRAKGAAA